MRHVYRCCRCRTRNTFNRALADYVRPRRCRDCGHRTFYVDKERRSREPCRCEGAYHWPGHRKGSPMCVHNPDVDVNRARRAGLDADDMALAGIGRNLAGEEIPF